MLPGCLVGAWGRLGHAAPPWASIWGAWGGGIYHPRMLPGDLTSTASALATKQMGFAAPSHQHERALQRVLCHPRQPLCSPFSAPLPVRLPDADCSNLRGGELGAQPASRAPSFGKRPTVAGIAEQQWTGAQVAGIVAPCTSPSHRPRPTDQASHPPFIHPLGMPSCLRQHHEAHGCTAAYTGPSSRMCVQCAAWPGRRGSPHSDKSRSNLQQSRQCSPSEPHHHSAPSNTHSRRGRPPSSGRAVLDASHCCDPTGTCLAGPIGLFTAPPGLAMLLLARPSLSCQTVRPHPERLITRRQGWFPCHAPLHRRHGSATWLLPWRHGTASRCSHTQYLLCRRRDASLYVGARIACMQPQGHPSDKTCGCHAPKTLTGSHRLGTSLGAGASRTSHWAARGRL